MSQVEHNNFQHISQMEAGRKRTLLRITCSVGSEGCLGSQDLRVKSGNTRTQFMAEKMFRNRKWVLGSKRSQDICPNCATARENTEAKPMSNQLVVITEPQPEADSFIVDFIRSNMTFNSERGLWSYNPGYNDSVVFQELASAYPDLTYMKVKEIRTKHVGKIRIRRSREEIDQERNKDATSPAQESVAPEVLIQLLDNIASLSERVEIAEQKAQKVERLELIVKQQEALLFAMKQRMEELSDDLDDFIAVDEAA